eukprot:CAMPEP_0180119988 /NCGR_PEP_ID=MMETSP0986-20121125/2276_1 /TAXON_ID=697907 /ORGANISM="non described non described, Strain CCMP2293" /LENGTH=58 /DNA_ID=CAMNT_0022059027 /DNA_START=733 /DNA_END=909 /DNA_ORIENTATION=-
MSPGTTPRASAEPPGSNPDTRKESGRPVNRTPTPNVPYHSADTGGRWLSEPMSMLTLG